MESAISKEMLEHLYSDIDKAEPCSKEELDRYCFDDYAGMPTDSIRSRMALELLERHGYKYVPKAHRENT